MYLHGNAAEEKTRSPTRASAHPSHATHTPGGGDGAKHRGYARLDGVCRLVPGDL